MSNLVIVAIPDENDRVWKVSSEKIPHLTLLFLGDSDKVSNLESITQFVEHAANTTLKRFYLPVDRRDELGEDKADTLIFKKGRYDYKAIRDFRTVLLKDNNIRTAHDSAEQHEGPWIPHLTLGYPANPAKPDDTDRDYGFYDVGFNKIAVWVDNYDGPEFLLKDYWDEFEALESVPMDVAMSGIMRHGADELEQNLAMGEAFLAHYGKKGMKWGVRNQDSSDETKRKGIQRYLDPTGHELSNDVAKTAVGIFIPIVAPLTWPANIRLLRGGVRGLNAKAVDSQEKNFAKNAMSPKNFADIHNGATPKVNQDVAAINKKYPQPNKDAKTRKQYDDEVLKSMQDRYRESANSIGNKNRTQHLDVEFKNDGMDFKINARQGQPKKVQHADISDDEEITVEITGKIKRDATGHISGFVFDHLSQASAKHAIEKGAEFLEHFASPEDAPTEHEKLVAEFLATIDIGDGVSHYGIKGMRWGVRREAPTAVDASGTSRVPHGSRRKTKIDVEGGQNHSAHEDAIVVAESKAKLKKSGVTALSNAELQKMAKRLQLETQVAQLTSSRGQKFIQRQLEQTGQQQVQLGVRTFGPAAVKKGAKKAGKVAATGAVGLALL